MSAAYLQTLDPGVGYTHIKKLTHFLMKEPNAQQLAEIYPFTLHTKWGRYSIETADFICSCELCFDLRLKRWRKVNGLIG